MYIGELPLQFYEITALFEWLKYLVSRRYVDTRPSPLDFGPLFLILHSGDTA